MEYNSFISGITTQTILTIPVNQLTNSNEQLVQTLAALNNSAASLNNIQMQSMQLPVQQQTTPGRNDCFSPRSNQFSIFHSIPNEDIDEVTFQLP